VIAVENVIIAIISGIVAVVVAIIGRSRITSFRENQEKKADPKLVETLNESVAASMKQIDILRGIVDEQRIQLTEKDREIEDLTHRVSNLEKLTIDQALLIRNLSRSDVQKTKARRTVQREDGETESNEN
jgi:hypothetical protein